MLQTDELSQGCCSCMLEYAYHPKKEIQIAKYLVLQIRKGQWNNRVINPIAHGKTKIAYNFGLSECNMVKR